MCSVKNVIVAGASGNLGPGVVEALLDSGFTVSILSRSGSSAIPSPRVEVIQTDYSPESLAQALRGQDAVVSTIGAFGTLVQTKLIDAAVTAKVKRFVPSDFAFDTPSLGEMQKVLPELYMRLNPKMVVLDYLKLQAARNPDFTWTAIGSGPLFDWTLKSGLLGISLASQSATITDSGNEPYPTSTIAQLARAVASSLQKPQETANKYLFVTSFTTTQNEILKACEVATGAEWQVSRVSSEQRRADGVELLSKGDFRGIGNMWNVWCSTDGKGHAFGKEKSANAILGLPEEDMVAAVKRL